jgi:hypothetical protein
MASISEADVESGRDGDRLRLCACGPLDRLAVGLSGACLLHCLALPALAAMLPILGVWAHAEWVHLALLLAAAPLSAAALLRRGRRDWGLCIVAALALTLMAIGAIADIPSATETALTVVGALTLAAAHLWNARRRVAQGSAC